MPQTTTNTPDSGSSPALTNAVEGPLTQEIVDRACYELLDEGKQPTTRAVRAYLGRGSLTTINALRADWAKRREHFAKLHVPLRYSDAMLRILEAAGVEMRAKGNVNEKGLEVLLRVEEAWQQRDREVEILLRQQVRDLKAEIAGLSSQLGTERETHRLVAEYAIMRRSRK